MVAPIFLCEGNYSLAVLVVCTLGDWAPLFERSWVQFPVSLAK